MRSVILATCLAACSHPAPPAARPAAAATGGLWTRSFSDEIVGAAGGRLWAWNRQQSGISEHDLASGQLVRTRAIADLGINGDPAVWLPVPGGYLASWDAPTLVREAGDTLAVAWKLTGDRWGAPTLVGEDTFVASVGYPLQSLALVGLDGKERWRTPLPDQAMVGDLFRDDDTIYAVAQVYDAQAPTPRVLVQARVHAVERRSGKLLWQRDFVDAPGALAVYRGEIIVADENSLRFIDGASGRELARTGALGHPHIYPRLLLQGDRLYVALDGEVSGVSAYALPSGKPLWQTPVGVDGGPLLAVADGLVMVTTDRDHVVALDAATGARRWDVGLGLDGHELQVHAGTIFVDDGKTATGFALPMRLPEEAGTVHGRVKNPACPSLAHVQVWVDGRVVPVDEDGRYQASLSARGAIAVVVQGDPAASFDERPVTDNRERVVLDGRGDYTVRDLAAPDCGPP